MKQPANENRVAAICHRAALRIAYQNQASYPERYAKTVAKRLYEESGFEVAQWMEMFDVSDDQLVTALLSGSPHPTWQRSPRASLPGRLDDQNAYHPAICGCPECEGHEATIIPFRRDA